MFSCPPPPGCFTVPQKVATPFLSFLSSFTILQLEIERLHFCIDGHALANIMIAGEGKINVVGWG